MNKRDLLEHHLHFLSKHRGRRESLSQKEVIHSDKADFNLVFPLVTKELNQIDNAFTIYLPDWVEKEKGCKLNRKKSDSISYMILSKKEIPGNINKNLTFKRAASLTEIEDFSLVQARGFCETQAEFDEWHSWLQEKNICNLQDKKQFFYVAYLTQKPIGVSLAIINENLIGIYAVATLPEFRNQGISTTLLKKIIETHQKSLVTLQVTTNSYAHSFYRKLGFADIFECSIFI